MPEPVRTCVGCRRRAPQDELVRIVHSGEGLVVSRSAPGRGAWLCAGVPTCLELALKRNSFSRALRTSISPALVEALAHELGTPGVKASGPAGRRRPRNPF
ncbi:MAG TPA: YlxR family protein [Acidimicrobiales bacterium]|nr:YlxR family protein [Acidimicrobiales bacterium]